MEKLPRPQYASLERISTTQLWFQIFAIRPTVFAIYEPYQQQEVISYLIVGPRKCLLIDTGMGIGNIQQVVTELSSLPLIVINTHTHYDHVGDNWRFERSLLGMNCPFSQRCDVDQLNEAQDEVKDGAIDNAHIPKDFDRASYRIKPFQLAEYVTDRSMIDLGDDRTVQVIFTPGHTPDSISLFDKSERLLFVGDVFYLGPIYLHRPETNLDEYVVSLRTLVQIIEDGHVDLVVPSHNTPNVEPSMLITALHAIRKVVNGEVTAEKTDDGSCNKYDFGEFSFVIDSKLVNACTRVSSGQGRAEHLIHSK